METKVKVYYIKDGKSYIGYITWDGNKLTSSNDSDTLKMVMTEPIYVPLDTGGEGTLYPHDDPEQFMRKLCWQYKSYRLRVTEPL